MKHAFPLLIASAGVLFASPSEDSQEILTRARAAYDQLKSCQMVLTLTTSTTSDESEITTKSKVRVSIEKAGKLRVDNRGLGPAKLVVSNGVDLWTYWPLTKQYTKKTATGSVQSDWDATSGVSGFLIEGKTQDAKLAGEDDVVIEGNSYHCYVIRIEAEHGRHVSKYWIDQKTSLILRTETGSEAPMGMAGAAAPVHVAQRAVVESLTLDGPIAETLFTFTPPSDAKLVEQFGTGGGNAGSQYVGKIAADFTLRDLNHKEVRLSQLRGKVVVLDFWATWCGPCREEMPHLEKVQKANKEMVVLGLDVGEDESVVTKFVAENHITFPILLADRDRVIEEYSVRSYPTTVVIDKSGTIRSYTVGYGPIAEANLRAAIERAGKEMPTNQPAAFRVGGGVSPPTVISKVEPSYSEEARKAKLAGTVLLSVVVSPEGEPKEIRVVRPLGSGLDEKAVEAVEQWRFKPGMKDGKPVPVQASVEVNFRLLDGKPASAPIPEPKTAEEAYYLGTRLIRERRVDEGMRLLSQAIAMKPDWAHPRWARGHASYQERRYEEAITDISKAIELRGTVPNWYDERGLAFSYSGRHERAIADYTKAIELTPGGMSVYFNNRGWAFLSLDQPEKALPDLNKAVELAPDNMRAHENRALAHVKLQQYGEAIADFTAAIELAPRSWQYEQRAQAKAALGDQEGAAEDRKQALELNKPVPRPGVIGGVIGTVPVPLRPSHPIDANLAAPELVLPLDQVVFDSYPRKTVCEWKPSPGAISYILEWDYQSNGVWHLDQQNGEGVGYPVQGTTYTFNFVGAQPGRWRVWPVGASGTRGKPSEWRTFRYTR